MKALAEASYVVPILSEVEPHDGILILKGDLEPEDLRIEANRAVWWRAWTLRVSRLGARA